MQSCTTSLYVFYGITENAIGAPGQKCYRQDKKFFLEQSTTTKSQPMFLTNAMDQRLQPGTHGKLFFTWQATSTPPEKKIFFFQCRDALLDWFIRILRYN